MKTRRKNSYTGILGCHAECEDCDFKVESKNALGTAARHADAHPDHTVHVEQVLGVTYNRRTKTEQLEKRQQCYLVESGTPHESHPVAVNVFGETMQGQCPGVPE